MPEGSANNFTQVPFENIQFQPFAARILQENILLPITWALHGTTAGIASEYGTVFAADRGWEVVAISEVHRAAGSGGALTIEKCASGVAPDSGVTLIGNFDLTSTANTPTHATLTRTRGDLLLKRGDRLVARDASIAGGLADVQLTILLKQR